ncbi:MAG TPA: hypothetical protein PKE66_01940 [Pyrinomonadaceae bacterium]|nr:hypothetical protein [Pyrinomonadaceae bacterium]
MIKNLCFALASILFFVAVSSANVPKLWSVNSRADVLKGEPNGVSVGANGELTLAPRLTEAFNTGQPYIWSSAADAVGNIYVGTGGEGRVFRVTPAGAGSLFADLGEQNVTAIAIGRGGEVYAATSPDGKVYRINAAGNAEVFFEPTEKYIWSLAVMNDGSLAVATGENGRIFRVRSAGAAAPPSLFYDLSELPIFSLAADQQGNLIAGTDSNGLVLRIDQNGKAFALLDSPLREVHSVAVGRDGSIYALAISESVSTATPAASPTPEPRTVTTDKASPAAQPTPEKSRYDLSAAKSAVYRIGANGANEVIWSSGTVVGFSLLPLPGGGGVHLGTSEKGRVYKISDSADEQLVVQTGAGQVSTLLQAGNAVIAGGSNQGVLYRLGPDAVAQGTYESPVLDARSSADWGRVWWRSEGNVTIETRSGNTEEPGETWAAWEPVRGETTAGKVNSPSARFVQWRATLRSGTPAATLREVTLALVPANIAPEITSLIGLPANVGLAPNPPIQIDPNIETSGMDPAIFGIPNQVPPPRRVYQKGAAAFQWTAEDRNGDALVYDVYLREVRDRDFVKIRSGISENFITIDGTGLADGRYIIKVVARDSAQNAAARALAGERTSEPFDVDNTQPQVTIAGQPTLANGRARVIFTAMDGAGYLIKAEASIDGGPWMPVAAEDGLTDGPNERFIVETAIPATGSSSVVLRVFDSAGNIGNARALINR